MNPPKLNHYAGVEHSLDFPRRLRKQLPAYGIALLRIRKRGQVPGTPLIVTCGRYCWRLGKRYWRICIPDDQDPAELDFSAVAGLSICIVHGGDVDAGRVKAIIAAILPMRPASLLVLDADLEKVGKEGRMQTVVRPTWRSA
jgi:hypothetical protein